MKRKLLFVSVLISCLFANAIGQGFLKRNGQKIVDGSGNNFVLRGIGLGGWMLQEGYMLQTSAFANAQYQIKAKIVGVLGEENTDTFYQTWLKNYIQKVDVDSMKAYGFNSIRLPMHYNLYTLPIEDEPVAGQNTWLDKGFALTDSLLAWCKANQIYLILDMHATPGGQGKDAAISDYNTTKPSLWESPANQAKLVALWKKLAERYANEEWIGGYDLINEINWDFENSGNQNGCNCNTNAPLLAIYKSIITNIRSVDTNHLIFIEGNCWGNNHAGLSSLKTYDDNLALSFHKYWNSNTASTISGLLGLRTSMNMPLWCGESGENSNHWYTEAISMFEANNIGWAWWTWKKMGSISGSNSIKTTAEYDALVKYWGGSGTKPTVEAAKATLMKMADNMKLANCDQNANVMDAMLRQPKTTATKPFKKNLIPGIIHAADYDLGRIRYAYYDTDSATYHSGGGTYISWNQGWAYRNDGVDIEACKDVAPNMGYSVGWTNPGEWLAYTVNADSTLAYKFNFRYASANASKIHLTLDGEDITGLLSLAATGGWATWKTATFDDIIIPKGKHVLKLHFDVSGSNVNYLGFEYSKKVSEIPLKAISVETSASGFLVYVNLNNPLAAGISLNASDFSIKVGTANNVIKSISSNSSKSIELVLTDTIAFGQTLTLSYSGTAVKDTNNNVLAAFTDFSVLNKRPAAVTIPAKIEAENYTYQEGLSLETCTDVGAGKNIAYTNAGDFLDYNIIVTQAARFNASFRIAANAAGGSLEFFLVDGVNKTSLGTLAIPGTGGWQTWKTIATTFNLPKGQLLFRVQIKSPEFNINWFSFDLSNSVSSTSVESLIKVFPNPAGDRIQVERNVAAKGLLSIYNLDGKLVKQQNVNELIENVDISSLNSGVYMLKYVSDKNASSSMLVKR